MNTAARQQNTQLLAEEKIREGERENVQVVVVVNNVQIGKRSQILNTLCKTYSTAAAKTTTGCAAAVGFTGKAHSLPCLIDDNGTTRSANMPATTLVVALKMTISVAYSSSSSRSYPILSN